MECFYGRRSASCVPWRAQDTGEAIELLIRANPWLKKYEILTVYSLHILECMIFLEEKSTALY
jgi:hypothetical protein